MGIRGAAIVLVEDDPADVQFVQLAMEHARIRNPLVIFDSVPPAQQYLSGTADGGRPALFIVDLRLIGAENGIDFLRWLRVQPGTLGSTPAMMLTGSDGPGDREESLALGALAFLQKPVTEAALTTAVQALGFVVVTNLVSGEMGFRIIERR